MWHRLGATEGERLLRSNQDMALQNRPEIRKSISKSQKVGCEDGWGGTKGKKTGPIIWGTTNIT